eukprot:NODE_790_length_1195_cov_109.169476_g749_i0.p1 GENE.NODE_790_length_1195_cov_109.169476_g749_i0~~NODE_790_length_1195_cov_109.169476_g749_i0.p1  ORF type:complete len:322 (-),score=70.87 NODE_790_length_1195_cov_109.169476_g749_i0:120-1085(-)
MQKQHSIADFKAQVLRRGSSARLMTKYDPLMTAVQNGSVDSVRQVFAEGYSLGEESTAMHKAFDAENMQIVKYLVQQQKVPIDTLDASGRSMFYKAVDKLNMPLAWDLFNMNADVNLFADDDDGFTPIHVAAAKGHVDLVAGLIDRGANPATPAITPDENDHRPLPVDLAKANGHDEVAEMLENETDPELLELKAKKDKLMKKLAPNAKKIVNNELTGVLTVKAEMQLSEAPPPPLSVNLVTNLQRLPISETMLLEEFSKYDADGNGWIMKEEFKKMYEGLENFGAPSERIDEILKHYNMLGDDRISFQEYSILRLKVAQR